MDRPDTINDCGIITITPMEVECVIINPSSPFSSDGSASISIVGGTPPYTISWGNGGLGLAIYNLSVGSYPAVITDFYGDFMANTVCVLTSDRTTTTSTTTTTTLKPLEPFCITYNIFGKQTVQFNMVGNGYDSLGNPTWIADNVSEICEVFYNPQISQWYFTCPIDFMEGGTSGSGQLFSTDSLNSNPPISGWFSLGVNLSLLSVLSGNCTSAETFTLETSVNQPTCECDGTISLIGSGGQPPYQYSINDGLTYQNNNLYTNICPGIYAVSIKDDDDNVVNESITINNFIGTTQYSVSLNTTSQLVQNTSSLLNRTYLTTLSVSPQLPVGVTITIDLQHLGVWKNSRKPGFSTLNRTVQLSKNGGVIPFLGNIIGSIEQPQAQCQAALTTVQVQTITNTWSNITITNGDVIIIETDSILTFGSTNSPCDFGTDVNTFSLSNATISGCDCCNVLIESPTTIDETPQECGDDEVFKSVNDYRPNQIVKGDSNYFYVTTDTKLGRFTIDSSQVETLQTFPYSIHSDSIIYRSINNSIYLVSGIEGVIVYDIDSDNYTAFPDTGINNAGYQGMVYDSNSDVIYIFYDFGKVVKFNCLTETIDVLPNGTTTNLEGRQTLAYNPTENVIYYKSDGNRLGVFDCTTDADFLPPDYIGVVISSFSLDSANNLLYIVTSSGVKQMNCATNIITDSDFYSAVGPNGQSVFNPTNGKLYYTSYNNNVYVSDSDGNVGLCSGYGQPSNKEFFGITYDVTTNKIYACDSGNSTKPGKVYIICPSD